MLLVLLCLKMPMFTFYINYFGILWLFSVLPHCLSHSSAYWRTTTSTGGSFASCCPLAPPSTWMGLRFTRPWRPFLLPRSTTTSLISAKSSPSGTKKFNPCMVFMFLLLTQCAKVKFFLTPCPKQTWCHAATLDKRNLFHVNQSFCLHQPLKGCSTTKACFYLINGFDFGDAAVDSSAHTTISIDVSSVPHEYYSPNMGEYRP